MACHGQQHTKLKSKTQWLTTVSIEWFQFRKGKNGCTILGLHCFSLAICVRGLFVFVEMLSSSCLNPKVPKHGIQRILTQTFSHAITPHLSQESTTQHSISYVFLHLSQRPPKKHVSQYVLLQLTLWQAHSVLAAHASHKAALQPSHLLMLDIKSGSTQKKPLHVPHSLNTLHSWQ